MFWGAYFLKNLSTLGTIASGALYVLGHLDHGTTVFHLLIMQIYLEEMGISIFCFNIFSVSCDNIHTLIQKAERKSN